MTTRKTLRAEAEELPEYMLNVDLPFLDSPGDLAHGILDGVIASWRDPRFRVELGAAVLATLPCARARLPFLPTFLVAMAVGRAAGWAFASVEEIKDGFGLTRLVNGDGGSDAARGV